MKNIYGAINFNFNIKIYLKVREATVIHFNILPTSTNPLKLSLNLKSELKLFREHWNKPVIKRNEMDTFWIVLYIDYE